MPFDCLVYCPLVELELKTAKSSCQLDSEIVQNNEADTNSEDENDGRKYLTY